MNVSSVESPLRLCIGPNLGAFYELTFFMVQEWQLKKPSLLSALDRGNYCLYVKNVLTMVNSSIAHFKLVASSRTLESRIINDVIVFA